MQKKRRKGKLIGEDEEIRKYMLKPNQALGDFVIGNKIDEYLVLPHKYEPLRLIAPGMDYETYYFFDPNICVWTVDGKIDSIACDFECYWEGENLVGMSYADFLALVQQQPDSQGSYYVPINAYRGQNQIACDFSTLGLTVWVWREKIRSVVVADYRDE